MEPAEMMMKCRSELMQPKRKPHLMPNQTARMRRFHARANAAKSE
jgi:hypothetical protein